MIRTKFTNLFNIPGVSDILTAFAASGEEIRFVGGCVRNSLLEIPLTDIDFVVTSVPEKTIKILEKNSIKAIPTGIKFGTITAHIRGVDFEITTARKDAGCDGRHAEVTYSTSFSEDAKRRDFTINSMSVGMDGKLHDYFHGQEDLAKGMIRFVGDAHERVCEDYLRILRLYRFYSFYGKVIDEKAAQACSLYASKINNLSAERIRDEFGKILISPKIIETLELMFTAGVLQTILPIERLELGWLDRLINNCGSHKIPAYDLRNLVALIYGQTQDGVYWIKSKKEQNYLKTLLRLKLKDNFVGDKLPLELYKYGREIFFEKNLLALSYANEKFSKNFLLASKTQLPIFPLQGEDLLSRGVLPGKIVGEHLKNAEELWIDSSFKLSKTQLLDLLNLNK